MHLTVYRLQEHAFAQLKLRWITVDNERSEYEFVHPKPSINFLQVQNDTKCGWTIFYRVIRALEKYLQLPNYSKHRCIVGESSDFNATWHKKPAVYSYPWSCTSGSQTRRFFRCFFRVAGDPRFVPQRKLIILSRAKGRRGLTHGGACLEGEDRESFKTLTPVDFETGWRWSRQWKMKRKNKRESHEPSARLFQTLASRNCFQSQFSWNLE